MTTLSHFLKAVVAKFAFRHKTVAKGVLSSGLVVGIAKMNNAGPWAFEFNGVLLALHVRSELAWPAGNTP